jgi:hypothetical protein
MLHFHVRCQRNSVLWLITVASQVTARQAQSERHPSSYLRADRSAIYDYQKEPPIWTKLTHSTLAETKLPRIIWSYWEQGKHALEGLNKICMQEWGPLNPGWEHRVLEKSDLHDLFPELWQLFSERPRTVQQRSDMLRLALLARFGGVWADASLLPNKPLDSFVEQVVAPAGFFAFTFSDPGRVASWFLAAMPKNPLILRWKAAFMERWRSGKVFDYFELHYTLRDMITKRDHPRVTAVWNNMPHVTEKWPHSCIKGCPQYWTIMAYDDIPPMLKRPFQLSHPPHPPQDFWAGQFKLLKRHGLVRRRQNRAKGPQRRARPTKPRKTPRAQGKSRSWGAIAKHAGDLAKDYAMM